MSALAAVLIGDARQQIDRVMSMLSLIEACLNQEMDFQDAHVQRPYVQGAGYIPGLGEVINTVAVCREVLNDCDQLLNNAREGV